MSEKKQKKKRIDKKSAVQKLWRLSELSWKLKGNQIDIYNHFKYSPDDITTCLISRRYGKTFTLCVLAIEECLKTPKAVVKYVCPTSKMVVNVMYPTVRDIIEDCPDDIKPKWYPSEKKWKFENGSEIQVAGTESGAYDSIRGGYSNIAILDEAGFASELETVVFNVLAPTTDTTEGKIFLASTPNDKDPNHDFHTFFVHPNEASGRLLKLTYETSPMIDDKMRQKIIARYPGGESNIKFRCEYLCEIPDVTENNVIPEFKEDIVKEVDKPEFCDYYTGLDVGFHDLTAALVSYWDFRNSRLVILDEYIINGPEMTTDRLVSEIRHLEELYYVDQANIPVEPRLRISDNNLNMINDMTKYHGMLFYPTEKHNKEGAVDTVRRWMDDGKIIIHPRCKHLIYHLKYAQWHVTKQGTWTGKFKHLKDSSDGTLKGGHVDTLDVLVYLVRNIQTHNNPYPLDFGKMKGAGVFNSPSRKKEDNALQNIMNAIMGKKEN